MERRSALVPNSTTLRGTMLLNTVLTKYHLSLVVRVYAHDALTLRNDGVETRSGERLRTPSA